MSNDYWEPWQPAIGDRVRVRISGECPSCRENQADKDTTVHLLESRDGKIGTVDHTGCDVGMPGHSYSVLWDKPIPCEIALVGFTHARGGYFAAMELELLTE